MKGRHTGKDELKLSLFAVDMIAHVENFRKSIQELLNLTSSQDTGAL